MNFKKNNLLNYINSSFIFEDIPLSERISVINNKSVKKFGNIVYLMSREFRYYNNFAINYMINKAKELNLAFQVYYIYPKINQNNKKNFFNKNFLELKNTFKRKKIPFFEFKDFKNLEISLLIVDFNPLKNDNYEKLAYRVIEIDGHNIIPARFISKKQEYSAMTFRRKVYINIAFF